MPEEKKSVQPVAEVAKSATSQEKVDFLSPRKSARTAAVLAIFSTRRHLPPLVLHKQKNIPMTESDIWELLGNLEEDQLLQVLTQLFARYEERLQKNPDDPATKLFFRDLSVVLEQVQSCNLNRR